MSEKLIGDQRNSNNTYPLWLEHVVMNTQFIKDETKKS